MENSCKYCAGDSKLDRFGYCIKYSCFKRSGEDKVLYEFVREASNLILIPRNKSSMLGITSYVSNSYNVRTRKANDIMYRAKRHFGYVPCEVLNHIDKENRKDWDKNIKW